MLLNFFILNILFVAAAGASSLIVTDGLKTYHLDYGPAHVRFKSNDVTLSLTEKACNKDLVEKLNKQVSTMLKRMPKLKQAPFPSVKIISDGQSFEAYPGSPSGKFLRLLPGEMKRLKLEEKFRCPNGF